MRTVFSFILGIVFVFVGATLYIGCNRDGLITREPLGAQDDNAPKGFGASDMDGGATVSIDVEPVGGDLVLKALNTPDVLPYLDHFTQLGFVYSPANSLVLRGRIEVPWRSDSADAELAMLAMAYSADTLAAVTYVLYGECDGRAIVTSWEICFDDALLENGFEQIADSLWWRISEPRAVVGAVVDPKGGLSAVAGENEFKKCFFAGSLTGCGRSAMVCTGSGPAYAECLAVGCTGSVIASGLACAIISLFD